MIPWIYHRLTPRDQGSDLLRIVSVRLSASGLLATLGTSYDVPAERTLLVTSLNIWGAAGGAQNFTQVIVNLTNLAGTDSLGEFIRSPKRDTAVFAQGVGWLEMSGSPVLIVPPNTRINFYGIFSAAAVANTITVGLNGILIPHGTFSE